MLRLALALVIFARCGATSAPDGGTAGGSGSSAGGTAGGTTAGGSSAGGTTAGGAAGGSSAGGATSGGSTGGGSTAGGSTAGGATGGGTSGGVARAGGSSGPIDGGVPAWRQGATRLQWVEIPGSSLSALRVPDPFDNSMVAPTQRINAWNGLAVNRDNNHVFLACAGGHGDWAGNEAYSIDLQADQPRWRMLRGPSPGSTISIDVDYYSDGRPSSTHLYYALHYVRARGRIFKLSAGSNWGSGNKSNSFVDAFNLTTNDYDPANTYAAGASGGPNIDRPYAQHPDTDDAYTFVGGAFRKWSAATATWETLAARPSYANNDIVSASPSAIDTIRNRVLFTRNAYRVTQRQGLSLTMNPGSTVTDVTFTGPHDATMAESGAGLEFVASEDGYFFKSRNGGTVVRIDPTTYATSTVATTGPTPPNGNNGVYNRWRYLPLLRGFIYLPSGSSNFWFLPLE